MVKVLRIRNMPTNSATTLATNKTWLLPPCSGWRCGPARPPARQNACEAGAEGGGDPVAQPCWLTPAAPRPREVGSAGASE